LEQAVLVYDVGGSHVSAAVCFKVGDSYRLGEVVSAPHPAEATSGAFLDLLHRLGKQAAGGREAEIRQSDSDALSHPFPQKSAEMDGAPGELEGAELAVPGPFDFAAGMSQMQHKLPYLFGVELRRPLAEGFGWQSEQIQFLNDAAAFQLGEVGAGAARGVARSVGFTLGTGIGSAFAVDGRIVTEGPGVPPGGEIWNFPYQGGIVEDFVSTRALQADYQRRTGRLRTVAELAAVAATDAAAAAAFVEFGRQLGLALHPALEVFAPDVVVLGGGISRSAQLFLPAAEEVLRDLHLQVRVSVLFDHAALVGAGVAWFAGVRA
jgi:glucokinase